MSIDKTFLDELRAIVGPAGHLDEPAAIAPFLVDHRKLFHGATPLVLRPDSTAQVSAILKRCNETRVGVVPVGGNTGYCGGATPSPDGSQIVLSLGRMRKVRRVDPLNYSLTVEAGCALAEVQAAATQADRLFPLSLGSEGSCQVGGNLSTNAGGTAVLRYGMMRDLVLGLEVVLPNGEVVNGLNGLRKNNTGYDLKGLFVGAEGTLGVITAATLKLFPKPVTTVTSLIAVANPEAAVRLLALLKQSSGDAIATFELMPRIALDLAFKHIEGVRDPFESRYDWYVLMEATSARNDPSLREALEAELAGLLERGEIVDAALAESQAQREMFWRIRENIPRAQDREGASIKHDISVTTSELPKFIPEGAALMEQVAPGCRIVSYGHLGDGNLHFNASVAAGDDNQAFLDLAPRMNRAIHDLVARYHGSFSAEHGVGQLKRGELVRYKSPVELELMRAIKRSFDPNGIMNPGKVL
jgi:FAD/FMN-containing dehydrogenase